jgi:probable phosphoglycerate mutase
MSASDRRVFFFARHGETNWNAEGRWQGQTDVPLNEQGRAQAKALGIRMRAEGIVGLASSDLARARETAEIAGRELGLALGFVDAVFRERAYGIFEGLTQEQCIARYPTEWATFERSSRTPPDGVEPLALVAGRMLLGLRGLIARGEAPVLVVSHGRAIRSLVTLIAGREPAPLRNGEVVRIDVENGEVVSVSPVAA